MRTRTLLLIGLLLLGGCSQFPTIYDRVDEGTLRLLDFTYEPAEAAPGDTVQVRALFAGAPVGAGDIDWFVSYDVVVNKYGVDTAFGVVPLQPIDPTPYSISDKTSGMAFRFAVPRHMLRSSSSIGGDLSLPVPPGAGGGDLPLTKEAVLTALEYLADSVAPYPERAAAFVTSDPGLAGALPLLTQATTARLRLFARIRGKHEIQSDYSVRYSSKLAGVFPGIPLFANRNPRIDSVGIYKVREANLPYYDPAENRHEFTRLYGVADSAGRGLVEIEVENGCSYFVAAFTSEFDSTMTYLAAAGNGAPAVESHIGQWYFQLDDEETAGADPNEYMSIVNMRNLVTQLLPPTRKQIRNFTIWCEVYDEMGNEIFRPQGSTVLEVRGRFR